MDKAVCLLNVLLFCSCGSNDNQVQSVARSYIYTDCYQITHVKSDCEAIAKRNNTQAIKPIHVYDINEKDLNKVCSRCVRESDIRELTYIYESRQETINEHGLEYDAERNRLWLYDKMKAHGINTGGYDMFLASLKIETDLEWYYKKCLEYGLDVGDYEDFKLMLKERDG